MNEKHNMHLQLHIDEKYILVVYAFIVSCFYNKVKKYN